MGLADSDEIDVHDIVSTVIRTTIEAFTRVKTRFRVIERRQRAQKKVSEVGVDVTLMAADMNLYSG